MSNEIWIKFNRNELEELCKRYPKYKLDNDNDEKCYCLCNLCLQTDKDLVCCHIKSNANFIINNFNKGE